jgi:hypothetical protein
MGIVPTDTEKWNTFGAEFESVATKILLAEMANIGDWIIKDGKITSQYAYDGTLIKEDTDTTIKTPRVRLDGSTGKITLATNVTKYTASGGSATVKQIISIDSQTGEIESKTSDGDTAYLDSQGVFANRAGTQALPATTGLELKAAVVALGYGNLQKSAYGSSGAICGVYGSASNSNSSPAPSYGGYFSKLFAAGLYLNHTRVTTTSYTIKETDVILLVDCVSVPTLYLPVPQASGKVYIVQQRRNLNTKISCLGGKQMIWDSSARQTDGVIENTGRFKITFFIWDGSTDFWMVNIVR